MNADFINSLSGSTSGVLINSSSGDAGSSTFITIRGSGSISGNNQPLFVGDGFCDDNTWGMYLDCPEFECDGGDCVCEDEPEIPSFCDSGDCDLLTFVVNTANIEVGPNGMYAGGGFFESATAVPLYENDPVSNDGFFVTTLITPAVAFLPKSVL